MGLWGRAARVPRTALGGIYRGAARSATTHPRNAHTLTARPGAFHFSARRVRAMGTLTGKVAIVTGSSRGIGAAIAKRFARDGAKLVVNYAHSQKAADAVVAEIKAAGGEAIAVK